jgi:hypothetical protein
VRRRLALVRNIIQGKTTVIDSSRQFDLLPFEIESWIDRAKSGMENVLKAKPEDIREQYESQFKALQEACGESMLELRARKNGTPCWVRRTGHDPSDIAELARRRFQGSDGEALPLVRGSSVHGLLKAGEIEAETSFGYRAVASLLHLSKTGFNACSSWWALAGAQESNRVSSSDRGAALGS